MRGQLRNGEMEKLGKWRNTYREELKKLPGKEAAKGGTSVKPNKHNIRF
jgi:hypothetical protein